MTSDREAAPETRPERDQDEKRRKRDQEEERRERYSELLQELRVVLPGVQVLLAFLLTVPFQQGFHELDTWGRRLLAMTLLLAAGSTITFLAPTALHRVARHSPRRDRLRVGISLTRAGLLQLGLAISTGVLLVMRHIYGTGVGLALTAPITLTTVLLWVVLPNLHDHEEAPAASAAID